MGIDDAVGAVSVHGIGGMWGVLAFGIFASGYPQTVAGAPDTNFLAQLIGAVTMALIGFVPGFLVSMLLKSIGKLRIPEKIEIMGMDKAKVPVRAYPEGHFGTPPRGMTEVPFPGE